MPPAVVVETADSHSEEGSKEIEVLEMQNLSAPSPDLAADGGGGSQHSLASIEDGPVVQETGDETARLNFQN